MPIPDIHPLHEVPVGASTATVATGQTATIRAPYTGRVTKIAATAGATVATAAATLTTSIAGTAITGGAFSIASGTTANTDTSVSTYAACTEGDPIVMTFSGSGTAGGPVGLTVYIKRGG